MHFYLDNTLLSWALISWRKSKRMSLMSFDNMFYHAGMRSTVNGFDHRQKVQKLFRFQRICYYFEARLVEHKI